jgi:hypothetical protein
VSLRGRSRQRGLAGARVSGAIHDFSLSGTSVTTQWGLVVVGTFTPIGTADEVYFELVSEDAGFAVRNG